MPEIVMPRLSDSMEEGTIVAWLVEDGGEVEIGQEIIEIETDKANMPYESDAAGTLRITAQVGETLPIGSVIATVGEVSGGDDSGPEPAAEANPQPSASARAPVNKKQGISASPVARRVAAKLGVELGAITGSGPFGRILKKDVVTQAGRQSVAETPGSAASAGADPASGSKSVPLSKIRQVVARRMAEAKATIPDFSLETDVNMSRSLELHDRLRNLSDPAPSLNDLIVMATGRTLMRHPRVNSTWRGDHLDQYGQANIGVAVATDQGLVVPTVRNADRLSLGEIAATSRELVGKARDGRLTPPELDGGTITVSNLGMLGVERFTGVINPPQAAILCIGRIVDRPGAGDDDGLVMVPTMTITMVCDHRVLDGADGARFLGDLRKTLEQPALLLL